MILMVVVVGLLVISFILAVRSIDKELNLPKEVKNIKIQRKKGLSGSIVFFKSKSVHYTSKSSSSS